MYNMNNKYSILSGVAITLILVLGLVGSALATPPHPDVLEKINSDPIARAIYETERAEQLERGIDAPGNALSKLVASKQAAGLAPTLSGTYKILVLLVDFSDHVQQTSASFFDGLIFDSTGTSVRTYYDEVSYGQFDIVTVHMPSTTGWFRAPSPYTYYVNGEYGLGTYPNNAQKLVEDLVDVADASIDFSQYDNDGDGYVDALVIAHSGPGREFTGSADDIHSHKWGISPRQKDGVYVYEYAMQPEYLSVSGDMTIGVFCHELGHVFGLPDHYDTDYSSQGVGQFCVMSYGSWNGTNGSSPAHPSAWCRKELGFATPVNVTSNRINESIQEVENGGSIYRMWSNGDSTGDEYFLIENRQQTGFDSGLPSSGLLIWHIDEAKTNNDAEWYPSLSGANHYQVALEQADGLYQLEHDINTGNGGDPFPGSTMNTSFSNITTPSSDSYEDGATVVAVTNISSSASTMTADLIVGIAAGIEEGDELLPTSVELAQNYPNPFNPETNIQFTMDIGGDVTLDVFNVAGQKVKSLFDGTAEPGTNTVSWDATNEDGHRVASGVYFYKLTSSISKEVKKMVLVR